MAYYHKLIAAWNDATQPPAGVTGTALAVGMTTQKKIDAVNSWTVQVAAPSIVWVPGNELRNAVVPADLAALTADQVAMLTFAWGTDPIDATVGSLAYVAATTLFAGKSTTLSQLGAVQAKYAASPTLNWCAANGYPVNGNNGNLSLPDCANAGLS